MKNITLAVDEDVLDRVRVIAAERKTTVNALVREYLEKIASEQDRIAEARRRLRELMEKSEARLGPDYKWNREEIYEDRVFPRHKRSDLRRDGET
jgi:uncharacterized protein (DUF4415 family)